MSDGDGGEYYYCMFSSLFLSSFSLARGVIWGGLGQVGVDGRDFANCWFMQAHTYIEQGQVRVGSEVVTDPAYLVTRNMEDYVTWVDSSKIKRNIMRYRDKLDDFDLL